MSEAYAYARISVDVSKTNINNYTINSRYNKDEETDTRWYKFNYSEIAGY